jgi:putative nucleotidyltransferase with HDIG domain
MTPFELIEWADKNIDPKIVKAMKESEHNIEGGTNPFHAESGVWSHTMMVMKEVERNFSESPEATYDILLITAFLHDIGKPFVRSIEETKKVSFKNHEGYGAYLSIDILNKMEKDAIINKEQKYTIFRLIAEHGDLYKLSENKMINRYKYDKKFLTLLRSFTLCDHQGRFCKEIGTRDSEYLNQSETIIHTEYSKNQVTVCLPKLYVFIGTPGSGKSTHLEKYYDKNTVVISRDSLVEEIGRGETYNEMWKSLSDEEQKEIDIRLMKKFNAAIREKRNIVVDMTNMSKKSRRKWVSNAPNHEKIAIFFMTSIETIMQRNKNRIGKEIPNFVIQNMMKSFSFPSYDEFNIVSIIEE